MPSFTAFAVTRLLREHFGDLDRRRVHRGDGRGPRPDFARRARVARFHHGSSTAATSITAGSKTRSSRRRRHADYPLIDVGVDPESGEPVRVRIGRYGPFLQLGEGGPGKTASLPPTLRAGRSHRREGDDARFAPRPKGRACSASIRRPGMNVYAINGRFGAYVQLGETPEKGAKEKPKRSSLHRQHDRVDGHARRGAQAARAAARARRRTRKRGSRSSPASAGSVRT